MALLGVLSYLRLRPKMHKKLRPLVGELIKAEFLRDTSIRQ